MKRFLKFASALLGATVLMLAPVGAQGKTLTVSWTQEPDSMNPLYTTMTFALLNYQLVYSPAWWLDETFAPVPGLVAEIPSVENGGLSEDGMTITLKLKEGLLWSDGEALDSSDFLFTYEMAMSPANTPLSRGDWEQIGTVEAPDATTVVMTFAQPYAPWLGLWDYVLPEHVLRPVFEADGSIDNADFNLFPNVSSGPYVLAEWDRGNFMRFTANPNYYGGVPKIETIVSTFIPDDQTYLQALLNGDAQLGYFVPFSDVPALRDAGLTVEVIPSGYNEGWFINTGDGGHPALKDVNVRKAVALAFDRAAVNRDLLADATFPPASFWENTPYANPDLDAVAYDPEQAAALLDEAGWVDSDGDGVRDKDGETLSLRFVTTTRQIRRDIQAVAQQQLAEVGIEVVLENYDSDIFFNGYAQGGPIALGEYDIAEWSSNPSGFPDPNVTAFECDQIPTAEKPEGNNWSFYCNPDLDALFQQQRTTTDFATRVDLFHQIDEAIYEAYVWVGVYHDADVWVVSPDIVGAKLNGIYPFWDVQNWDLQG